VSIERAVSLIAREIPFPKSERTHGEGYSLIAFIQRIDRPIQRPFTNSSILYGHAFEDIRYILAPVDDALHMIVDFAPLDETGHIRGALK